MGISALMVFAVTPIFDPIFSPSDELQQFEVSDPSKRVIGLLDYDFWSGNVLYLILISCLLAFCVNLSIFLTIGKTSPITYNVLGHFKLCVVTIGGTLLFNEDTNSRKGMGVAIALVGITMYTYWKLQTSNAWDKRAVKKITPTNIVHGSNGVKIGIGDEETQMLNEKSTH